MSLADVQLRFVLARMILTDEGFVQLYRRLGFKGQVIPKTI